MEENNNKIAIVEAPDTTATEQTAVDAAPKKKATRSRKKVVAPMEEQPKEVKTEIKKEEPKPQVTNPTVPAAPSVPNVPKMPSNLLVRDFCDLVNSSNRIPMLSDQQIQQLTYEDAIQRNLILEAILSNVLDYDIVLSDTNIWLELLVGHTSSHSDPRVNARLMFERQLEFISRMSKKIGGKFMIMSETYEEIDRFATMQEPTDYKVADWKDEALCRNVAARLAKRLILSQQKENRLRIEGIGSESHHAAFADPAIIRRTVELFAQGKKVLLLTNDASVGIRSLGMCDDLQRTNQISDTDWRAIYEPQRPMVLTMDDLKVLDQYTRQYHFLMVAAGRQWMQDVPMREPAVVEKPLVLWMEGFRPGDRHERRSDRLEKQRQEQQERQRQEQERQEQERQRKEQQRLEDERRAAEKQARREEQERREQENRERKEQARLEQERREAEKARREEQRKADRERAAAEKAARQAAAQAAMSEAPAAEAAADVVAQPTETVAPPTEPQVVETSAAPIAETTTEAQATVAESTADASTEPTPAVNENAEVAEAPVVLPPLSPEMMELMGNPSKKKPTRRGGRRRKTNEQGGN